MALRLAGKVALITGGASGIGRATALLFAREGAKVVIGDRDTKGNDETAAMIGENALAVELDVTKADQVQAAIEKTIEHFGELNILFNNAGIGEATSALVDLAESEWERVFSVNAKGVFLGIKYGAAAMIKAGKGGVIINNASVAGLKAFPGHSAYAASKAACVHLSRTAALELAGANIRVNVVAPGFSSTPMVDLLASLSGNPERALKKLASVAPLNRLGTADEIANGVLYLASDEAAFVTGTVLAIDGGATAV